MKVEEKAKELYPEDLGDCNANANEYKLQLAFIEGYNYATQPTTTETLQEGDWTKCEKFSEWVALDEIEGVSFDVKDLASFLKYKGERQYSNSGNLYWGKGENFLPHQEFKKRAENTFKNK